MISRRSFIRILGIGGASGILIGGGAYWAGTRGAMPESAIAPWRNTGSGLTDPRLRAAAFAMLAPNPHNLQSWQLRLEGDDTVFLHVDLKRLLPHTDPFGRQVLIGQGTFLELFRMAAAEQGYRADIQPFPEGAFGDKALDARPVARITLARDSNVDRDPLFAQVGKRRSNKEPYDTSQALSSAVLNGLTAMGTRHSTLSSTADKAQVQKLRDLTEAALIREIETPQTLKESIDLMRIGPDEVAANPDGIALLGPMIWWGERLGMLSREDIATPGTESYQVGIDMARNQTQSAMGHAWLTTRDNSRLSQLQVGMDYVRLNLKATELGLALHPLSQVLQEYAEMAELQQRFRELVPGQVQMLVRLGYAKHTGPSPRRPLDDIIPA